MEPMEPQSPATAAASAAAKTIQITSDLDTPISARLISVLGLFVMIAIAWAMSTDRKKVPWRIMAWGIGLQVALGFVVLQATAPHEVFWAQGMGPVSTAMAHFIKILKELP